MKIRVGDTVKVLYGKDAGTTGKVVRIMRKSGKLVVEGKNLYKRHIKGDGQSRKSEIVAIAKPMPIAKVQLVDADGKPTRVGYKMDDGKKVRIAKKSGKTISLGTDKKKDQPVPKAHKKADKKDEPKADKKKSSVKSKTSTSGGKDKK